MMLHFFPRLSKILFFLIAIAPSLPGPCWAVTEAQINSSRPYIVSIKTRTTASAYSGEGSISGTGSIIDKKNGILLTNAHVIGPDKVVPYYEITLHNGREVRASLLYMDPWHDFAFLKVRDEDISKLPAEISIDSREIKIGEPIYMIGKNENKPFSPQKGIVSNIYETIGVLPSQVFRISQNAQGGASGSPVFSKDDKVIGLVNASDGGTFSFALPITYVLDALKSVKENKIAPRYATGIIIEYKSLDDLVRFYNFPADIAENYRSKFPNAFNQILSVKNILAASPGEEFFEVGDVITHVNGIEMGPNYYLLDKMTNEASALKPNEAVEFTVIRRGKLLNLKVKTYDLNQRKIQRMVQFGGAIFYEADDAIIQRTGARDHRVFVTNIRLGSSFFEKLPLIPRSNFTLVSIIRIGESEITCLQDVIDLIPSLVEKNDFFLFYKNYGVEFGIDALPFFAQTLQIQEITYSRHDGLPEIYTLNPVSKAWTVETIGNPATLAPKIVPLVGQAAGEAK
jgi:S1-C subfamily serine protease